MSILSCIKVENFEFNLKDSSFQLWYNLLHFVWYCQCFVLAFLCIYPIILALYTTCNEALQVFTRCTFWKIGPYYLYINIFEVHVFQMANSGLQYKMQLHSIVGLHDKQTSSWWFVGTITNATTPKNSTSWNLFVVSTPRWRVLCVLAIHCKCCLLLNGKPCLHNTWVKQIIQLGGIWIDGPSKTSFGSYTNALIENNEMTTFSYLVAICSYLLPILKTW